MVSGEDEAQATRLAGELDAEIEEMQRILAGLADSLSGTRSPGFSSRLRQQINTRERELADLHRMRFQLRARFGV